MTFDRHLQIVSRWLDNGTFRHDVPLPILAEGIQAFGNQTVALHFCTTHAAMPLRKRLLPYLQAWPR